MSRVLKAELICAMNIRKDYCIAFFIFILFCFFFLWNEEKLCLRVAYFYWSKSEWSYSIGVKLVLTGFHLYLASGWNLEKKWNLNKIGESFLPIQMNIQNCSDNFFIHAFGHLGWLVWTKELAVITEQKLKTDR